MLHIQLYAVNDMETFADYFNPEAAQRSVKFFKDAHCTHLGPAALQVWPEVGDAIVVEIDGSLHEMMVVERVIDLEKSRKTWEHALLLAELVDDLNPEELS